MVNLIKYYVNFIKYHFCNIIQILYMDNIYKTINKLYDKQGFYEKYGTDTIIAIIIIFIFFIWTTYYYVLNHIPLLRVNWEQNKCNPAYIPFAGMIINDPNKSNLDVVRDNFINCTENILLTIIGYVLEPIYYIMSVFLELFGRIITSVNQSRSLFNDIRKNVSNTSSEIYGRTLNITMPMVKQTIAIKSMFGKIQGILQTFLYTLFGNYMTLKAFAGSITELITKLVLIPLSITIAGLWASAWFFGATIPAALAATAIYIAIMIPLMIVVVAFSNILNVPAINIGGPPGRDGNRPSCFDKNTLIKMYNNESKYICNIKPGEILHDGSIVTGTMKLSSCYQKIYNLNNIIVSGCHRIYHDTMDWIYVSDHPDAVEIFDYTENIIYCLNTDTNIIKINDMKFSDWDDLDDKEIEQIKQKCLFLPKNIYNKDIHKYLNNGLEKNTLIRLKNNNIKKINNIEVNDILYNGEIVLGIIEIDSKYTFGIKEYQFGNTKLKCSNNIQIYNKKFGYINTNDLTGSPIITPDYLYQLVTNSGYYYIDNIKIYDYNAGIEKYL
uniref:Uncharacterized protein n=1 Tax=viral metagenome TaxID=1070528 RepID=A0A6C0AZR2_9ZZZZ